MLAAVVESPGQLTMAQVPTPRPGPGEVLVEVQASGVCGTDLHILHGDYWGDPQPLFTIGVEVDEQMLVRHPGGDPVYTNLYAAGGILAGATRWQEKSGEGIAVASAVRAADSILAAAATATDQGAAS